MRHREMRIHSQRLVGKSSHKLNILSFYLKSPVLQNIKGELLRICFFPPFLQCLLVLVRVKELEI